MSTKITTKREFRLSLSFFAERKHLAIPLSDFLISSVLHQLPI